MNQEIFNEILNNTVGHCITTLNSKAKEYATSDRLHNFKVAATLQGVTPTQALGGMMAKHTISIYDMIESGEEYSSTMWDEKIGDHINYLILLKALISEDK